MISDDTFAPLAEFRTQIIAYPIALFNVLLHKILEPLGVVETPSTDYETVILPLNDSGIGYWVSSSTVTAAEPFQVEF